MIKFIQDIRGAIDHVKKSVDLLKVVEDELGKPTKTSGRDHMWCCPFHQEKTPSFGVHDGMQIIKCFGCGVGGDLFVFVQNYYGLSMVEAIQFTAMKYGVDIAAFEREPTPEEAERHRYILIQNEVASFCTKQLLANQSMKDWFMKDTGFNIEQIVDYDVGYSQAPDTIATHLHSVFKDMTQSELDKLELTKRTMWTDALVYAIRDPHGSVLRFYNKPLSPPPDLGGKYLGTSANHPLFTNKLLYGFHNVRKTLKDSRFSIRLVEGQKAAIASGAVAILGSSIKAEQIELLKEYKIREVRICFDGDEAGRAASLKLLDVSGSFDDIHVLVGKMPTDVQPDDLAKTSKAALDQVFAEAALPVEYFIDTKRDATGAISTRDKFGLIRDLKEHLSSISPVQMDMTSKYLSEVLSVDEESVRSFVSDLKSTKSTLSNKDVEQAVLYHVMMNPNYWSTTSHAITNPKAFTVMAAQKLFQAILSAHKKVRAISTATDVTVQVIRDEVSVLFPQYPDLVAYVDSILSSRPKYEFIDGLNRVCDLSRRREGIEQSKIFMSLLNDMGKATGDVVSKYRRSLVSTLDVRKDSSSTPSQLANALMKEMHERSLRQGQVIGHDFSTLVDVDGQKIPSLTGLCLAMSGLQKQHQVVVSANSGVGKSLITLQMATSMAICPDPSDRIPTLWIPLEMNAMETTMRIVSLVSGVDNNKVQGARLTRDEALKVRKASEMIAAGQLYIEKPRTGSIDEIFSIIDEYHFKYGIKAVFLDYIQLIAPGDADRGASREEVIGRASKVMKNQVAEGLGMVSVSIAQQNRMNFKLGEVSKIENVGGSYQIAQDADDFITMSEKTAEQMTEEKHMRGNRKLFIDKRRGGSSDVMIDLMLDTMTYSLRFREMLSLAELQGLARSTGVEDNNQV